MPAYISHAIMGEQLYNEATQEHLISRIPINIEELKGYSLGADLAYLSKQIKKDPHDYCTKDFFINIIKYIKDNNLTENSQVIALLYGHIAHYFLDINTHPLIYYIECGCKKIGNISNHNLIEGYLNAYLSKIILGKNLMEIKSNYFNQIDLTNKEMEYKLDFEDDKPKITYNIQLYVMIDEIIEAEKTENLLHTENWFVDDSVVKGLIEKVKENLDVVVNRLQQDNIDIIEVYDKFYKFKNFF